LREIIKDMQAGDANITAFQTLIINLSSGNALMGVKATLAGVTLTAADITQAETLGIDAKGLVVVAQAKCDYLKQLLGVLVTDVLTPASDAAQHHDAERADHGSVVGR
jgi:hypothetical protein